MQAQSDRVDFWHVDLDAPLDPDFMILSTAEQERAARFATFVARIRVRLEQEVGR